MDLEKFIDKNGKIMLKMPHMLAMDQNLLYFARFQAILAQIQPFSALFRCFSLFFRHFPAFSGRITAFSQKNVILRKMRFTLFSAKIKDSCVLPYFQLIAGSTHFLLFRPLQFLLILIPLSINLLPEITLSGPIHHHPPPPRWMYCRCRRHRYSGAACSTIRWSYSCCCKQQCYWWPIKYRALRARYRVQPGALHLGAGVGNTAAATQQCYCYSSTSAAA